MNTTTTSTTPHPLSRVLPKPSGPMSAPARFLGWFSIGLGVAEVLMPRAMAGALGMPKSNALVRTYGLREIGTGIGLLTAKDPSPWLWGRVAGDALDITTVSSGLLTRRSNATHLMGSMAMLAGIAWLDAQAAKAAGKAIRTRRQAMAYDYSSRSGFPKGVAAVRGIAAQPSVGASNRVGSTPSRMPAVSADTPVIADSMAR